MTVRILHGHVIDALASLDPESVQCVITSVPYWGLRSYKTEHQVWGGNPRCAHGFDDQRSKQGGAVYPEGHKSRWQHGMRVNGHAQVPAGAFCLWCGAWRGEHGLEPSLDLWLDNEVLIWRAIRRVLRKDGLAFLNIGDSYAGGGRGQDIHSTLEGSRDNQAESRVAVRARTGAHGLKAKQRLLLPARLAIALQGDDWWIRDEIIWNKSNPMPSSVDDRTTPAHETVYLLSKRARYFSDFTAIEEPFSESSLARLSQSNVPNQAGGEKQDQYDLEGYNNGSRRPNEIVQSLAARLHLVQTIDRVPSGWDQDTDGARHCTVEHNQGSRRNSFARRTKSSSDPGQRPQHREDREPISYGASGNKERVLRADRDGAESHLGASIPWSGTTRNKRSVWTIPTEPFPQAHFATFPTRLVEPMILCATSARGACTRCGAPWLRVTVSEFQIQRDVAPEKALRGHDGQKPMDESSRQTGTPRGRNLTLTSGWYPTCGCDGLVKLPPLPPAREKERRLLVLEQRGQLCAKAAGIPTRPCVVLDPFFGSGTVGLVADKMEPMRDCIGIELNAEYVEIARHRIAPLLVKVSKAAPRAPEGIDLAAENGARHGMYQTTSATTIAMEPTDPSTQGEARSGKS